jgi:alpha-L-rhamnosidase
MNLRSILAILLVLPLISTAGPNPPATLKVTTLRTEYLVNPIGIDVLSPRLAWTIEATSKNVFSQKQSAYQVLVASSPEKLTEAKADLWNSGKVKSGENAQIVYQGKAVPASLINKDHKTAGETALELGSGKYSIVVETL